MWILCIVGYKWGGLPAQLEEEAWGLLLEVSLFPSLLLGFHVAFYFFSHFYPFYFSHLLGAGSTEKGRCPMEGSPEIRNGGTAFGGLWLGEDGSCGGRLRGGGFLWASEGSNVTFLHVPRPTSS